MDRELRLAELIGDLRDRMNRGERLDPETLRAEHPEFAGEILAFFSFERFVEDALGAAPTAQDRAAPDPLEGFDLGSFAVRRRLGEEAAGPLFLLEGEGAPRALLVGSRIADRPALRRRFLEASAFMAERRVEGVVLPLSSGRQRAVPWAVLEHRDGVGLDAVWRGLLRGEDFGAPPEAPPRPPPAELGREARRALARRLARDRGHVLRVVNAFIAWGEVLDAAHREGLLHGGLSPRHLKRDARGRAFVEGFGLGVFATGQDVAEAAAFDRRWLAPELAHPAAAIGLRCDVHGLGAALHTVLGLALPREDDDEALPAELPAGLRDLVGRCRAERPADRPRDLGRVVRDLRAVRRRLILTSPWTALALLALVGIAVVVAVSR